MHVVDHDGPLIIGAGLAGLCAALAAAPRRVLVVSPSELGAGSASAWAQGGIAAALSAEDDPALHAADTLAAGDGLCDPAMVDLLTREGPAAVNILAALGAPFDRTREGGFALSLEAAHGLPRVARVGGDGAGAAILNAVIAAVRAAEHVTVLEGARLAGLIQTAQGSVTGAWLSLNGEVMAVRADAVLLATGGLGGLYAVSTNPSTALGEGLALAALAGATIADPEFVQFHPTALDAGLDPAPLVSEAVRGEGAVLVNHDGTPFMAHYSPAGDLAPRHVVAQAVHAEIAAGRGAALEARTAIGAHFPTAFPAVFAACQGAGIDPRTDLIPVAPAAHYHMGGIATDKDGAATPEGLFAAGECASTGVQGANRLASNSLLEAAVFGTRAGAAAAQASAPPHTALAAPRLAPTLPPAALNVLRAAMARDAGVVRDAAGLERLLGVTGELEDRHGAAPPLIAARLIAQGALQRRESRGGHYRADYPQHDQTAERTMVTLRRPQLARDAA
jgi:L-aspartate oxidase